MSNKPREWWIIDERVGNLHYLVCSREDLSNDYTYSGINQTHVIEYSAYEAAVKERDDLKASMRSWEVNKEIELLAKDTRDWNELKAEVESLMGSREDLLKLDQERCRELNALEIEVERLKKERTEVTSRGNVAYLWFGGKDGWQVTSFHPKDDPAIRDHSDAKMYINYDEHLRVCNMAESYRAKLAQLVDAITSLDETYQESRNYLRKAIVEAKQALEKK